MTIIGEHIRKLLKKEQRADGRALDEYRKDIKIEYGVSSKNAEGSARVKIGETEVIAGVKLEVGKPYPDVPDKGSISVNVELLPLSSPEFESGPPDQNAIELARAVVDRGIRESDAIDFKALCIKEGEEAWFFMIDAYSLNNSGNLADAVGLAALAALKDTKYPKYDAKKEKVDYKEKTNKGVVLKELPIAVSILKIDDKYIVDPSLEEEGEMDARLTITTIDDGRICAMQKGGEGSLTVEDIEKMVELATKKGKELRKLFK
jgi:exosome complex component RRP42